MRTKLRHRRAVRGHAVKLTLLGVYVLLNRQIVFRIIGWLNRRFQLLDSVFVVYPASDEYALSYVYRWHRELIRRSLFPSGIFRQGKKWGLMVGISSTERDFHHRENEENLRRLVMQTEQLRKLTGARHKKFAGVLPSVISARALHRDANEAEVTLAAVLRAEAEVRAAEGLGTDAPLIVLGGMGYIGRRLIGCLAGREVYCVDQSGALGSDPWPEHLRGRPALLINLTRRAALSQYLHRFWPELVLLNEVYPEPMVREVRALTEIGSPAYHLVGVRGRAYPRFPHAYAGGIPCCAAQLSGEMQVIVRQLN